MQQNNTKRMLVMVGSEQKGAMRVKAEASSLFRTRQRHR